MCDAIAHMSAAIDSPWCAESGLAAWSNALEGKPMLNPGSDILKLSLQAEHVYLPARFFDKVIVLINTTHSWTLFPDTLKKDLF